jgi:predicted N-formylglutamate amidohydrolase
MLVATPLQGGQTSAQSRPQLFSIHKHTPIRHDIGKERRIPLSVLESEDIHGATDNRRQLSAQINDALKARVA